MIRMLNVLGVNDRNRIDVVLNKGSLSNSDMHFTGNLPLVEFLASKDIVVDKIALGGQKPGSIDVQRPDVIFNSICDPDSNRKTLQNLIKIIEALKSKVINDPQKILQTSRDKIYTMLKGSDQFYMPKTIKVTPRYLKEVVAMLDQGEITLPFIFREAGAHGGKSTLLVRSIEEIHSLEQFAFDGRAFYITEFIEFVSKDGMYRKYRIVMVDGKPYARHMIASSSWAIHVESRDELMPHRDDLRKEEKAFIGHGSDELSSMLEEIYEKIGLDFFGLDFALNEEGKPILFEVNACMNTISVSQSPEPFSYHNIRHQQIRDAVNRMIHEKVKQ